MSTFLTINDWIKSLAFLIFFQIAVYSYLHFQNEARERFWYVYLQIEETSLVVLVFSVGMLVLALPLRRLGANSTPNRLSVGRCSNNDG
jgi:uncharacterized membrane protein